MKTLYNVLLNNELIYNMLIYNEETTICYFIIN